MGRGQLEEVSTAGSCAVFDDGVVNRAQRVLHHHRANRQGLGFGGGHPRQHVTMPRLGRAAVVARMAVVGFAASGRLHGVGHKPVLGTDLVLDDGEMHQHDELSEPEDGHQ